MTLDPAVAAVRGAIRPHARSLDDKGGPLLVACSGGADSLALLSAAIFEVADRPVIGVTVDHGLQDDSAAHAARVVEQMESLGAGESVAVRIRVEERGNGPEAAAREARYAVLSELAARFAASAVLLGHTRDDQAETVLMGLARGSGGRSIAGMRPAFEVFRRPLLGLTRAETEAACVAQGIGWWVDPHNLDPRFLRARIRNEVMPMLERELGPGVSAALARTGQQVALDVAALDAVAEQAMGDYIAPDGFAVERLRELPPAVRSRVLRLSALAAGCPPGELFAVHIDALEAQVSNRAHLPKSIQLPGHITAIRSGKSLRFMRGRRD